MTFETDILDAGREEEQFYFNAPGVRKRRRAHTHSYILQTFFCPDSNSELHNATRDAYVCASLAVGVAEQENRVE